jgi:hypothetical protein
MKNPNRNSRLNEREFLSLAAIWLACRLAVMGGTPEIAQHQPVTDFQSLGWAMLGCVDYAYEMKLMVKEVRQIVPSAVH